MKQLFKILLAVSVIAFAVSMTAVSCGKPDAGGGNNNNNNNNSGGGDGNGNSGPPPAEIVITNVDASVAEVKDGTNIELKASGFPTTVGSATITHTFKELNALLTANSMKRAFDLVITKGVVGGAAATAGLLLVDTGDKAKVGDFTVRRPLNSALAHYTTAESEEGTVHRGFVPPPVAAGTTLDPGYWLEASLFMKSTIPATADDVDPDTTPFAFTQTTGANATRPIMFCLMGVTTITFNQAPTGASTDGRVENTTVLTGGQKSSCYVSALGAAFTGTAATTWLNTAASNTFKKKFNIAAGGIRTDGKTIAEIGLPGTDKATAFHDGITPAEMAAMAAANPSAYKKFSVTIK